MNAEAKDIGTDSKYGKGFAIRMVVLLGLLALVGAGLFYDRVMLPKKTAATIENAYELMVAPDEDGHGITKDRVRATIGFEPESESVEEEGKYTVEKYQFKRALPWVKGDYISVIYENGALIQILQNQEFSKDKVEYKMTYRSADPKTFKGMPVAIGGVPTSSVPKSAGGDKDDAELKKDKPAEDETENEDEDSDEEGEN